MSKIKDKPNTLRIKSLWMGLVDYKVGFLKQKKLYERVLENPKENYILFLEHNDVITIGRRGDNSEILVEEDVLKKSGISVIKTDRGGQVTGHNPGQLTVYFIMHLKSFKLKPVEFVRFLETSIARTMKGFGLNCFMEKGKTGVWIDSNGIAKKIAAIGLKVSNGVTTHGFALNISNDLRLFKKIISCGMPNSEVTSMSMESKRKLTVQDVIKAYINELETFLNCRIDNG